MNHNNMTIRRKRSRNCASVPQSRPSSSSSLSNVNALLTAAAGSCVLLLAASSSSTHALSVASNHGPLHSDLRTLLCPWSTGTLSSSSSTALYAVKPSSVRRGDATTRTSSSRRAATSSSTLLMVEPMKPLTPMSSVSRQRREVALETLMKDRTGIESALEGVDTSHQVLELLSEDYLYPTRTVAALARTSVGASSRNNVLTQEKEIEQPQALSSSSSSSSSQPYKRPRRQELVPGAMSRAAMKRYMEKQALIRNTIPQSTDRPISGSGIEDRIGEGQQGSSSQSILDSNSQQTLERYPPSNERIQIEDSTSELHAQPYVESDEVVKPQTIQQRDRLRGISSSSTISPRANKLGDDDTKTLDLPGTASPSDSVIENNNSSEAPTKKSRRRVVKNLPKRKEMSSSAESDAISENTTMKDMGGRLTDDVGPSVDRNWKNARNSVEFNNQDLKKYYVTPLLSPQEEFDLGQKIQMMIACEQVHEGLSISLSRIPTVDEWAKACGYVEREDGPDFVCTSTVEHQIRPSGYESMFKVTDPNLFVGNGLAHMVGVGRGRGRARKPPPTKLRDVYDEREDGRPKSRRVPLNRGTTRDFCDMMLEGRNAKQRMVQSNMRLVLSISRKYTKVGINLHDIVQEGTLGLSRAAEKYDPTRGFKFATYASWWIQQAVFRAIASDSRTIRLPVHIHNMLVRVRKVRNALQLGLGRTPTEAEMADAMDMAPSRYRRMIRLTRKSISLELPQYKQNPKDYGFEGADTIADMASSTTEIISPEKSVERSLFQRDLKEMLTSLNEDELRVIQLRYGLKDGLTRTVTSVAAEMKQTPGWVRSNESKALRKLRRPWYEQKLKEHQNALSG